MTAPSQNAGPISSRSALCVSLVPGLVSLGAYLVTLKPEVGFGDSAELALQSWQLGVTHPPGYPVHTFLGKLLGLVIADPALATNLLSAVCTSAAVSLLSLITLRLTGNRRAAFLAPLAFAFAPTVWDAAVKTEVYNVNVCLVAAALMFALSWHRRPSGAMLCGAAGLLGLSLGSSVANVLIVPGFLFLIWHRRGRRVRRVGVFLLVLAITGATVLSWSYARSTTSPPLGSVCVPDTLRSLLLFLSGAQYGSMTLQPLDFYLSRLVEHAGFFAASFLWLGIVLGFIGFHQQWRTHRPVCMMLLLMFVANMGYFTCYPWIDYREMVTVSYFVFALWLGCGLCAFDTWRHKAIPEVVKPAIPAAIVLGLLASGLRAQLAESRGMPVTDYVRASFEMFPQDATVVSHWYTFAPLVYFQETEGLRPDVRLVERSRRQRHYSWGIVEDWRDHVRASAASRPTVTDLVDETLSATWQFRDIGGGWYQVAEPPQSRP